MQPFMEVLVSKIRQLTMPKQDQQEEIQWQKLEPDFNKELSNKRQELLQVCNKNNKAKRIWAK